MAVIQKVVDDATGESVRNTISSASTAKHHTHFFFLIVLFGFRFPRPPVSSYLPFCFFLLYLDSALIYWFLLFSLFQLPFNPCISEMFFSSLIFFIKISILITSKCTYLIKLITHHLIYPFSTLPNSIQILSSSLPIYNWIIIMSYPVLSCPAFFSFWNHAYLREEHHLLLCAYEWTDCRCKFLIAISREMLTCITLSFNNR